MTFSKTKSVSKSVAELLVNKFYNLRETFEEEYSGQLRSGKYEETREFTIALNFAIFQANQLLLAEDSALGNSLDLEVQLESLRQNFVDLTK